MIRRLLRLYPRAWRERYEEEIGDLITDQRVTPRLLVDVLRGILDAHLHPELVGPAFDGTAGRFPVHVVPTIVLVTGFVLTALWLRPTDLPSLPAAAPRAPAVALRGAVMEFVSYDDVTYGYRLAVPKDAQRERSSDGRRTTFAYRDEHLINGTYTVRITVTPVEAGTTPEGLLLSQIESARRTAPPRQILADGDGIVGAALSYVAQPSARCPSRRAFIAAFISGPEGYVINIDSDADGRCDAERVPQTRPEIESLRPRLRQAAP